MYGKTWNFLLLPLLVVMLVTVSTGAERKTPCDDLTSLAIEGRELSAENAAQLEETVRVNPNDLPARAKLLGYYFLKTYESENARKARQKHILWIIENKPSSEIAGRPEAILDPLLDEGVYSEAKRLWLKQVQAHEINTVVLGNAANFFFIYNEDLAEGLLKKAQELEPENPEWSERLGQLYSLMSMTPAVSSKETAMKSLKQLESALSNTTEERNRFYILDNVAKAAFKVDDIDKATTYATDLLNLAPLYKDDWNYGNAIHHANLVLGRIALKSGDVEKAKIHLIESGRTPGSPQLNSFGPSMTLAKELLEVGENEVVIEYLHLCKKFWEMDNGRVESWIASIKGGGMPDFGPNLLY